MSWFSYFNNFVNGWIILLGSASAIEWILFLMYYLSLSVCKIQTHGPLKFLCTKFFYPYLTVEKFSNVALFPQIASQNLRHRNIATGFLWLLFVCSVLFLFHSLIFSVFSLLAGCSCPSKAGPNCKYLTFACALWQSICPKPPMICHFTSRWFQIIGITKRSRHCSATIYLKLSELNVKISIKYSILVPEKLINIQDPSEKLFISLRQT